MVVGVGEEGDEARVAADAAEQVELAPERAEPALAAAAPAVHLHGGRGPAGAAIQGLAGFFFGELVPFAAAAAAGWWISKPRGQSAGPGGLYGDCFGCYG